MRECVSRASDAPEEVLQGSLWTSFRVFCDCIECAIPLGDSDDNANRGGIINCCGAPVGIIEWTAKSRTCADRLGLSCVRAKPGTILYQICIA